MADIDSVFCPRCKVGFAPDTPFCPICRVPLVFQDNELQGGLEGTPEPIILKDDLKALEMLRTADTGWIHHLQVKLREAGIPHRVELSRHRLAVCSVYVRPEDLPRAKNIDDRVFANEVPDAEGMARPEEFDFWFCPACGSRLDETAIECNNCGLVLCQNGGPEMRQPGRDDGSE